MAGSRRLPRKSREAARAARQTLVVTGACGSASSAIDSARCSSSSRAAASSSSATTGQDAIRPARTVASQRSRTAGSRWRTQADVSTTSGIAANGSATTGFALGVDRARGVEVVVGLAAGDTQQVLDRPVAPLPLIPLRFRTTDREIPDQARPALRVRINGVHRRRQLGVDGHLNAWMRGRDDPSVPPLWYTGGTPDQGEHGQGLLR